MSAVFEIYKEAAGDYGWRFRVGNGRVITRDRSYTSKAGALNAVEAIKREAATAPVEDWT